MKHRNKPVALFAAAALAFAPFAPAAMLLSQPVFAEESQPADPGEITGSDGEYTISQYGSGDASVTINANSGQTMIGKKFNIYQLFTAQNSLGGESINYEWTEQSKQALQNVIGPRLNKEPADVTEYEAIDYIQSLNTNKVPGADAEQTPEGSYSDFRYFIENLRNELETLNVSVPQITVNSVNAQGGISFTNMPYGYYLVDEIYTNNNDGDSAASLCMVDTANPDATINIKSDYPSVTKKIEEDDNDIGWNDIGDYEIGQFVPFRYQTTVPNMNGYQTYMLAFQDVMDEALTFQPDTVKIEIEGKVDPNSDTSETKTYTLASDEYQIITGQEAEAKGLTFEIKIPDLRAIVNREFPGGLDEKTKENIYGQQITVYYDAVLNDKAADATGRPGFENKVRLEFSNEPDDSGQGNDNTGHTPWDTVVAFTFQIDLLKTNQDDKTLQGAKFRLYSDEDCTNEVYVKEGTDREGNPAYIIMNSDTANPADAVEMVTNESGVINVIGFDQGTYWLKETEAPAGYRPILDPIKITIQPTFTDDRQNYTEGEGATDKILESLTATADITTFNNGFSHTESENLTTDVSTGMSNMTIINQTGSKLPITGSGMMLILIGGGALAGGLSVGLSRRKKH